MLPVVHDLIQNELNEENLQFRRRRRCLRNQFDLDSIPEARFKELFRINKALFNELSELLKPYVPEPRYKSRDVPVEQKLLVALRYFATGSYQRSIGEDFNIAVSQTCISRYIHEVTNGIEEHICPQFIKFPTTRRDVNEIKQSFMDKYQFPGILGVIDGSHIAVLKPKNEEHNFINRKGFHSLNIQMICDSNLRIMSINANYPGSCHDSFVWRNSAVREHMYNQFNLNEFRNTWLIGDSGYPLEPFLITPFFNPVAGSPESRYNYHLTRARNCVERCIGVLKSRFRCLLRERVARYEPAFVGKLVNVCAALHNMCLNFNIPLEDLVEEDDGDVNPVPIGPDILQPRHLFNEGQQTRNQIVRQYFTRN